MPNTRYFVRQQLLRNQRPVVRFLQRIGFAPTLASQQQTLRRNSPNAFQCSNTQSPHLSKSPTNLHMPGIADTLAQPIHGKSGAAQEVFQSVVPQIEATQIMRPVSPSAAPLVNLDLADEAASTNAPNNNTFELTQTEPALNPIPDSVSSEAMRVAWWHEQIQRLHHHQQPQTSSLENLLPHARPLQPRPTHDVAQAAINSPASQATNTSRYWREQLIQSRLSSQQKPQHFGGLPSLQPGQPAQVAEASGVAQSATQAPNNSEGLLSAAGLVPNARSIFIPASQFFAATEQTLVQPQNVAQFVTPRQVEPSVVGNLKNLSQLAVRDRVASLMTALSDPIPIEISSKPESPALEVRQAHKATQVTKLPNRLLDNVEPDSFELNQPATPVDGASQSIALEASSEPMDELGHTAQRMKGALQAEIESTTPEQIGSEPGTTSVASAAETNSALTASGTSMLPQPIGSPLKDWHGLPAPTDVLPDWLPTLYADQDSQQNIARVAQPQVDGAQAIPPDVGVGIEGASDPVSMSHLPITEHVEQPQQKIPLSALVGERPPDRSKPHMPTNHDLGALAQKLLPLIERRIASDARHL